MRNRAIAPDQLVALRSFSLFPPSTREFRCQCPNHNRRMVAVAHHHRQGVLTPPVIKVTAVVIFDLAHFPHIEGFMENQEIQTIARVQKCRGKNGLCADADGVPKPAAFSNSTRRSFARWNAAAPSGPLSWCTLPPANLIDFPFSENPFSADHASVRMPNGVITLSITLPPRRTVETALYSVGVYHLSRA